MENNIEKIRKAQNMTQGDLAQKAGISRVTIGNFENGKIRVTTNQTMEKIAKALGKKINEVFYFDKKVK